MPLLRHLPAAAAGVTLLTLLFVEPLRAQAAFCFRGRPVERCRTFLITEFTTGPGLPTASRRPPWVNDWELGAMRNIGTRSAVGLTAVVNYDEDERAFVGARPRFRRWISQSAAVDLSGGILFPWNQHAKDQDSPLISLRAGIMWKDLFGFSAGLESMRIGVGQFRRTETTLVAGLRFGSYAGIPMGGFMIGLIRWGQSISD